MDGYSDEYGDDRRRKIIITVAVVGVVVLLLGGVTGMVLWSRSRGEQGAGGVNVNKGPGQSGGNLMNVNGQTVDNSGIPPLNEPPVSEPPPKPPDSATIGGTMADAVTHSSEPGLEAGINRYLTDDEKNRLGFPTSWKVRFRTVETSTGVRPEYLVEEKPTDQDNDGLSDEEERQYRTDPAKPDTDGDGLTDYEEVQLKTDPTMRDTDGDTIDDGTELKNKSDPLDPASK